MNNYDCCYCGKEIFSEDVNKVIILHRLHLKACKHKIKSIKNEFINGNI